MSTISLFKGITNKHDVRRKLRKKFWCVVEKYIRRIINYKKKKVINKRTAVIIWKYKHLQYF